MLIMLTYSKVMNIHEIICKLLVFSIIIKGIFSWIMMAMIIVRKEEIGQFISGSALRIVVIINHNISFGIFK